MNIQTWIETLLSDQSVGDDFETPVLLAADADRVPITFSRHLACRRCVGPARS